MAEQESSGVDREVAREVEQLGGQPDQQVVGPNAYGPGGCADPLGFLFAEGVAGIIEGSRAVLDRGVGLEWRVYNQERWLPPSRPLCIGASAGFV